MQCKKHFKCIPHNPQTLLMCLDKNRLKFNIFTPFAGV